MSAIISDKFRIYNAEQFLSALGDDFYDSEGNAIVGPGVERNNMYFFVGRPQAWRATLEIYGQNATSFTVGTFVFVGAATTDFSTTAFRARVVGVYDNALVLEDVGGTSNLGSTPPLGSTIVESAPGDPTVSINPLTDPTALSGATAITGVYRYATEDSPAVAFDNDAEFFSVYDDLIAAKRMTISFTRGVIRRFNWALSTTETYDMYKNDYSQNAPASGITGKLGSNQVTDRGAPYPQASSLGTSKFYVMNGVYEVFKCLYNGSSGANPNGIPAVREPSRTPGAGAGVYRSINCPVAGGLFLENIGGGQSAIDNDPYTVDPASGYIWKFMYKLSIDDVLRFLSTDFIPVSLANDPSTDRGQTESLSFNGSIQSALVENAATSLVDNIYFAPVVGDGSGAIVRFTATAGSIGNLQIINPGSGYTYGRVLFEDGTTYDNQQVGLFTDATLVTSATTGITSDTAAIEVIISPRGGHGAAGVGNIERELNTKRVMTNILLTYAEGRGDFPVDNDFRRIGILRDPSSVANQPATEETLNNLKQISVSGVVSEFEVDEVITQVRSTGGIAKGRVVSYESTGAGTGIISYYQSVAEHTDKGVVRDFEGNTGTAPQPINGTSSNESATVVADNTAPFTDGLRGSEFIANTGDILYLENRRLITRAPDQIEDIKLVIEF